MTQINVPVVRNILQVNDRLAAENRRRFDAAGIYVIGKFEEILRRPDVDVHVYDHHPDDEDDIRGNLNVVKPLGATATILIQLIRERHIELTPEEATILSLGIFEDTGSFTFKNTTHLYAPSRAIRGLSARTERDPDVIAEIPC